MADNKNTNEINALIIALLRGFKSQVAMLEKIREELQNKDKSKNAR